MNAQLVELIRKMAIKLPNWATSAIGILGSIVVWNQLYTLEAMDVFISGLSWDDLYNTCLSVLFALGGVRLYNEPSSAASVDPAK